MYQALYRKYRPRRFLDVAGQEHITETLRRQIVSGRLSHAYLFVGTRGTGKTTCAKILSRAVNCQAPVDGDPCNVCPSCIGIENGSILDVLELDAASNNGVDNVRALREEAIYSPASVYRRVYIIDEVHMLSTAAFNALLKILEEPPEHLIFILATTELHKVPATILSRCQRFSFKRLSPSAIAARLAAVADKEGLSLTMDAAERLAALADGSMRDGLSLLDQCATDTVVDLPRVLDTIGLAGQQELLRLAEAVAVKNTPAALGLLENLYDDGKDMAALLGELSALMRDLLVHKLAPDSALMSGGFSRTELTSLSGKLKPERLFSCLEVIRETMFNLSRSGSAKLSVEMCLIRLCDERLSDDIPALLARIARLESTGGTPDNDPMPEVEKAESGSTGGAPDKGSLPGFEKAEGGSTGAAPDNETEDVKNMPESTVGPEPSAPDSISEAPGAADMKLDDGGAVSAPGGETTVDNGDQTPGGDGGDFWRDILELLKSDVSVYAPLSDSTKVKAELRGSILVIHAEDIFTVGSIESGLLSEPLKNAACKALGRDIVIRVETAGSDGEVRSADKLGSLRKYSNVKFE